MILPVQTHRPGRPPQPRAETPIYILTAVAEANVLTLTFDQPVILSGTPAFTTDIGGRTAVSAVRTALDEVAITFNGSVAGTNMVNLPFRDPAIRNAAGGYVTGNMYIL